MPEHAAPPQQGGRHAASGRAAAKAAGDGIQLSLKIDFFHAGGLGPGKIRLLELIQQLGSISAAGREMKMSYRRAWLLVESFNRMFAAPVVESHAGGTRGGGARLTAFGLELIARYRRMQGSANRCLAADLDWLAQAASPQKKEPA